MLTITLVVIVLLEAAIIYGLIVSDRFRVMCKDIIEAIHKACRKQPPAPKPVNKKTEK